MEAKLVFGLLVWASWMFMGHSYIGWPQSEPNLFLKLMSACTAIAAIVIGLLSDPRFMAFLQMAEAG